MAINQVRFQKGLSMVDFMRAYGTELQCYRALYRSQWPKGFRCPACRHRRRVSFRLEGQIYYKCRACRRQAPLLSGTLFEATKQVFIVAVETDETLELPVCAVLESVRSFDNASMQNWAARGFAPEAEVFVDGLGAFRRFADAVHAHTIIQTGDRREVTETKGAGSMWC